MNVRSTPVRKDGATPAGEGTGRERREVERCPVDTPATAFCLGYQFGRIFTIKAIDYSTDGLGAFSDAPIEPGCTVSIGLKAPGLPAGCGTVVRCCREQAGYHLGVRFEPRK